MKICVLNASILSLVALLSTSVVGCNQLESKEAPKSGKATVALTDSSFSDRVENGNGVAVVDFWAEWCGPCKAMEPLIESVAEKYEGAVLVGKVDVDSVAKAPSKYNIRSIPTLLFFKDGKKVGSITGLVSQKEIEKELKRHL